jgi:hypothetical protein
MDKILLNYGMLKSLLTIKFSEKTNTITVVLCIGITEKKIGRNANISIKE